MDSITFPSVFPVTCHTAHVGPGSTFVAIKGMKNDGVEYIEKALSLGATKILVDEAATLSSKVLELIKEKNVVLERVTNTRQALAIESAQAHNHPARSLRIIGVTGTKGKTTTAFLIEHILRTAGYKTALISTVKNKILNTTFDAHLTTPQPDYLHTFFALCREQGVQFVIMEVAAQALSLYRTETLSFDTALFTNFSLEHSEFYESQDDYFAAKCILFKHLALQATVILNADDERVAACGSFAPQARYISIQRKTDFTGIIEQSDLLALKMQIHSPNNTYNLSLTTLLGSFSAYNLLAAVAVAETYACSIETIEHAVATFEGVPGRLQRFPLPNYAVAFIDNAHTPSSFEALLSSLRPLSSHIIAVFGAGGDRDSVKRPVMGAIAVEYADQVILTTDNPRSEDPASIVEAIQVGISEKDKAKVICELDREKAIRCAYALSKPGTIIALLGKGPVEYQHVRETKIPFSEASILRSL